MLDHYLFLEQSMGGGIISRFVSWVSEFGHDLLPGNPNFRLETVIFGGILGSLYAILQFFFAPIWGGLSDRYGRRPVLIITLGGTAIGYFLMDHGRGYLGSSAFPCNRWNGWGEHFGCHCGHCRCDH